MIFPSGVFFCFLSGADRRLPTEGGRRIKKLSLIATGAVAGLLNGLFGAGGGMALVPMLYRSKLPAGRVHATSIAIILPLTVASSFLYHSLGRVDLSAAAAFIPLGLVGAWLGAWLLPRIRAVWLHRMFGALAIYSAVRLLLP